MQASPVTSAAASAVASLRRALLAAGFGALLALLGAAALVLGGVEWAGPQARPGPVLLAGFGAVLLLATGGAAWLLQRLDRIDRQTRRSESQQRLLLELSDDWLWSTDAAHRLAALRPSPGTPPPRWPDGGRLGRALWEEFAAEAPTWDAHRAMMEARAPFHDLHAHRRESDGRLTLWRLRGQPCFDAEGRFTGYEGSARELTAEADAAFLHRALRRLLDLTPAAALVAQAEPGEDGGTTRYRLRHCNEAAARHLGEAAAQLAGRELLPLLRAAPGWPLDALRAQIGLPAETPEDDRDAAAGWHAQVERLDWACGGTRFEGLLLSFVPAAPAGGDETARMADLERDAVRRELESFSYTVSHDLRAPLRVVEGFAKILKEDYGRALDRIGIDHLDRVLGAAARMNGMIDALLALSQLSAQPLARQPVHLSQLAGFIVEDLRRQSPQRDVEVRIQPGMTAEGDPVLLRVLLDNLIGNAWKYSARRERAQIEFACETQGGRSVYRVRDNGAGFDMRFADRLFGVFQRLHSASDFQGTGIGLATVQRIVQRHGGQIWAEAEPDRGATFFFTLAAPRRGA